MEGWRGTSPRPRPPDAGPRLPLDSEGHAGTPCADLATTILGRGSARRFSREPISYRSLSAILDSAVGTAQADFLGPGEEGLLGAYLIVNAVDGVPPGAYHLSREDRTLELLVGGDFREEAGNLCFEQALGADASAVVFLMVDLERLVGRFGNRGYRAAQMEAGVLGGRIYLAAGSLGLGATGLTFYDDDVTGFFSPHGAGKSTMFVVSLGVKSTRNQVRPYMSRVGMRLDAQARGAAAG